jgi:hypothetical protein
MEGQVAEEKADDVSLSEFKILYKPLKRVVLLFQTEAKPITCFAVGQYCAKPSVFTSFGLR